ncbi:MAG: hypothetical protein ACI4OJ_11935 [Lachnospiraceae bacterium]
MTLTEQFDGDVSGLRERLERAGTPMGCQKILEEETDHLLLAANSGELDGWQRDLTAALLSVVRMELPLLAGAAKAELWETQGDKAGSGSGRGLGFLVPGALLVLVPVAISLLAAGQSILFLLLPAAGGVLLYFAGRRRGDRPGKKQKIEITADPEAILSAYRNALVVCDQCRKDLRGGMASPQSRENSAESTSLTKEELSLCAGLLGAARLRDGEYALEEAQKVQHLLEVRGYEVVDCSDKTLAFFERLPGDADRTLLPAIVKDGKLLCRGQASRKAGH